MARNWPRDQQRKYKAERQKQAQHVADRLLGKKKFVPENDGLVDALNYKFTTNLYVNNPQNNFYIMGFTT